LIAGREVDVGTMLTAVSYNIHSAVGRDGQCVPERILRVIGSIEATIVGLQEVDTRVGGPRRVDQFAYLSEQSGMHCLAGPNIVEHRGQYGNALLTRLPVEHHRLIRLPAGTDEPRGAICAVLRCGGTRLQVVNTHLGLRRSARREQARVLCAAVSEHEGPTLFLGDYNVWHRRSPTLRGLGAPADIRFAPKTFPARRPVFALDRIWTRPLVHLEAVRTIRDGLASVASDHLPVVASLRLDNRHEHRSSSAGQRNESRSSGNLSSGAKSQNR
jgi:endonuclease/exonuclease/phosphatase family metal-dependent hydrolase